MASKKSEVNYAELKNGEFVTIEGREVNRVQHVSTKTIMQNKPDPENPTGAKVKTPVTQHHFTLGQRSFTITDDEINGKLLMDTVQKKAKVGNEVVELYLIANSYQPPLLQDGEVVYEDDGVTPVLSDKVNKTWQFDGLTIASQDMAEEKRETDKISMRNKANILGNAETMAMLQGLLKGNVAPVSATVEN